MNKDLRPEDFWPEAEKLLDNHYNARRKRRAIMWFIAALTIIGASIYFISDRRDGAVVVSESGKQVNTKSEENFTNRSEVIPESYRDQMSNASNVNVAQDDNLKEKRKKRVRKLTQARME